MEYLNSVERVAILQAARDTNATLRLMLALSFAHGLRVTELISLRGSDVHEGRLRIIALKNGISCSQDILIHENELIDCSPVIALAAKVGPNARLFPVTRMTVWRHIQSAAKLAGVDSKKAHPHACRHSTAMMIWDVSHSLGEISSILRHRSPASSFTYLRELDSQKAINARNKAMAAMAGTV